MVWDTLAVERGEFEATVHISKNGEEYEGDLCYSCLLDMLAPKPKRKYERKSKPEQVSLPLVPTEVVREPASVQQPAEKAGDSPATKSKNKPRNIDGVTKTTVDISTFLGSVGLEQKDDEPYTLKLGEVVVTSMTLTGGIDELFEACGIDEKFVSDAPDSQGKRELQAILGGY